MALITRAIRGTQDVLPKDSYIIEFVEGIMKHEAQLHGFREIRTPVFEHTELFLRSMGEETDVVQKEMYTFKDKADRSITLRPEGTAGVVRAMLENGLYNDGLPLKVSYISSCYRYEKPQAGRLREFHQFGVEVFGTASPVADAELISMAHSIFERMGAKDISLEINSIGCPKCRAKYYEVLRAYFSGYTNELCPTCNDRLKRSPMRILDCKSPICREISKGAPSILEYLCDECREHFEEVKAFLHKANIEYKVNSRIVRGLDYYTKTVFEFVSNEIGAQGTVCGGGRYDGLVKQMGGQDMPSLGFGLGIERLLLLLEKQKIEVPKPHVCDIYIGSIGEKASLKAFELIKRVRESGMIGEIDIASKSVKAQMKYANKIDAKFSVIIGDEEIEKGTASLKNMSTGEVAEIPLDDKFFDSFLSAHLKADLGKGFAEKEVEI